MGHEFSLDTISYGQKNLALTYFTPANYLQSNVNMADGIRRREQERTKMVAGSSKLLFLLEPLGLIEPL